MTYKLSPYSKSIKSIDRFFYLLIYIKLNNLKGNTHYYIQQPLNFTTIYNADAKCYSTFHLQLHFVNTFHRLVLFVKCYNFINMASLNPGYILFYFLSHIIQTKPKSITLNASDSAVAPTFSNLPRPDTNTRSESGVPAAELRL